MTNRFNSHSTSVDFTDGSLEIYAKNYRAVNIVADLPLRSNSTGIITTGNISQTEVTNLSTDLTNKLDNTIAVLSHETTPLAPSVGFVNIYSKSDNNLYIQNNAGNEAQFSTGSSSNQNLNTTDSVVFAGLTLNQENVNLGLDSVASVGGVSVGYNIQSTSAGINNVTIGHD